MATLQDLIEQGKRNTELNKNVFLNNIEHKSKKDFFNRYVNKITWISSINEDRSKHIQYYVNTKGFKDIQIIQVDINMYGNLKELGIILTRTIISYCIILFKYENKYKIFMYDLKKQNKKDMKISHALYRLSYWIYPEELAIYPNFVNCLNKTVPFDVLIESLYNYIFKNIFHIKKRRISHDQLIHILKFYYIPKTIEMFTNFCTEEYSRTGNVTYYDYGDIWYCFNESKRGKDFLSENQLLSIEDLCKQFEIDLEDLKDVDEFGFNMNRRNKLRYF